MKPKQIFASQRLFRIWLYTVSHRALLLRSVKTDNAPTRIDLLFKGVKYISLASELAGANVHALGSAPVPVPLSADEIAYQIESSVGAGQVIAASFDWHEDEGEYDDESYFAMPRVHWD